MPKTPKLILWPTNLLGNHLASYTILIGYPYEDKELEISWSGKRMDVVYATVVRQGTVRTIEDTRLYYLNGDNTTETLTIHQSETPTETRFVSDVYIKVTDCTQLVVNGVCYIYNGKVPDPAYIDYYADQFQPILGVHNPTPPDETIPDVPNILTYYANKFKAIFGMG